MFVLLLLIAYAIAFAFLGERWRKLERTPLPPEPGVLPSVSIVIPYRNEALHLPALLEDLRNLDYPEGKWEVILVDDHSEDGSTAMARRAVGDDPHFRFLALTGDTGKKAALRRGARASEQEWLVFTDADVRIGPQWLRRIAATHAGTHKELLLLPVVLSDGKGWLAAMQEVEFLALMATTMSMASLHRPVLANGANLAVKRSRYLRTRTAGDGFSSGDDMFLLLAAKANDRSVIGWSIDPSLTVTTPPIDDPAALLAQRLRWAGKSGGYHDREIWIFSLFILCVQVSLVASFFFALVGWAAWSVPLLGWGVKTIADLWFVVPAARWWKKGHRLWAALPLAISYPFYVCLVPLLAWWKRPEWKGRTISLGQ